MMFYERFDTPKLGQFKNVNLRLLMVCVMFLNGGWVRMMTCK